MRGVQRVVRALQQIGDDERRVRDRHRDDPGGEPARRRDRREQHAERHAAERRERQRRRLARQAAAVGPREREQRQRRAAPQRRPRAGRAVPHQPAERERGEQRHGDEREIRQTLRARVFGGARDEHEARSPTAAGSAPSGGCAGARASAAERPRQRHERALDERQHAIEIQNGGITANIDSRAHAARHSTTCSDLHASVR